MVQPSTTTAAPELRPAIGTKLGTLRIDAINVRADFFEGTDTATQRKGPGLDPQSARPGEPGTVVIEGHRTTYTHPFVDLDRVHAGDRVDLTTTGALFAYSVEGSRVVKAADLDATLHTSNAALALVTQNPKYSAAQRLVVSARYLGDLTSRIEVESPTVKAGTTMHAALVTQNDTGAPLRVQTEDGCQVLFGIMLANRDHPAEFAFPLACFGPLTIPAGTHRYPFNVQAVYAACSGTGAAQGKVPACGPGSASPPLPPGHYFATYGANGGPLPIPLSVPVEVLPAG